ncbi:MAG: ankyrin repeat domain-containing protein [Pyrinomonadaceae bacterium]
MAVKYGIEVNALESIILFSRTAINSFDASGTAPLHNFFLPFAQLSYRKQEQYANRRAIVLLLEAGANPNLKNSEEKSPLHLSIETGLDYIGLKILSHPSTDPNATDLDGRTPLHWALGLYTTTPLSYVPEHSNSDRSLIVEALLRKGANILAKDRNARTPLDLLSPFGMQEIQKLIRYVNATPDISVESLLLMDFSLTLEERNSRLKYDEHRFFSVGQTHYFGRISTSILAPLRKEGDDEEEEGLF